MRSALTMEYRRIFLFYASARAFRLHELHYLTAMVVDTSGGGPAVGPSGQTYRNAAPSGEDDLACRTCVFPTTQTQPPLSRVTTVPVQEPAVDSRRKRSGTRLALTPSRSTLPSPDPASEASPVP